LNDTSKEAAGEFAANAAGGIAAVGILMLGLWPLALPIVLLTTVALLPVLPIVLIGALLAAPIVLVRRLARRRPRQSERRLRLASRPRSGQTPCAPSTVYRGR